MATPSSHRIVPLLDARGPNRVLTWANLYRGFPSAWLEDVESEWQTARQDLAERGLDGGLLPVEHSHRDWRNKTDSVEAGYHMLVGVEVDGAVQGIMAVLETPRRSRATGEPIIYVDYLETVPWNLRYPGAAPHFLGVGTVLIGEAIRLSLDLGFEGRVGLHSLPQAEPFYRVRCGMTEFEQDRHYYDLTYFEFGGQQALDWLTATGGIS